jgi:hypothetical protein
LLRDPDTFSGDSNDYINGDKFEKIGIISAYESGFPTDEQNNQFIDMNLKFWIDPWSIGANLHNPLRTTAAYSIPDIHTSNVTWPLWKDNIHNLYETSKYKELAHLMPRETVSRNMFTIGAVDFENKYHFINPRKCIYGKLTLDNMISKCYSDANNNMIMHTVDHIYIFNTTTSPTNLFSIQDINTYFGDVEPTPEFPNNPDYRAIYYIDLGPYDQLEEFDMNYDNDNIKTMMRLRLFHKPYKYYEEGYVYVDKFNEIRKVILSQWKNGTTLRRTFGRTGQVNNPGSENQDEKIEIGSIKDIEITNVSEHNYWRKYLLI